MHGARRDAASGEAGHLIFHKRNEGRDYNHELVFDNSRQLVAEGFTASCGQHGEHVFGREHILDDLLLAQAKNGQAETLLEHGFERRL